MANQKNKGGFKVGYSIPLEMMCVIELLQASDLSFFNPPDFDSLRQSVSPDWLKAWGEMFPGKAGRSEPLKLVAQWSENIFGEDYSEMTLGMRALTLEEVGRRFELKPTRGKEKLQAQILKAGSAKSQEALKLLGLKQGPEGRVDRQLKAGLEYTFKVLAGGELHARFWHLLDRFWFEFYKPWRSRQIERMRERFQHASSQLGQTQAEGIAPALEWLPSKSPLRFHPPLTQLVTSRQRKAFFWVEPFGLFDYLLTLDDTLIVPFGDPASTLKEATKLTESLAARCKALGDPTRVMILRMIRDFSFDNTTMANYLGLARPTVSVHCKILREAGLIETEIVGRQARHHLNGEAVKTLLGEVEKFLDLREPASNSSD